jgi:hypothetical protein
VTPRADWTPPIWTVALVLAVAGALTPGACDQTTAPAPVPLAVQR